jgi:hypothetical protein
MPPREASTHGINSRRDTVRNIVEILEVTVVQQQAEAPLIGFIDLPSVGDDIDHYHFSVMGWVRSLSGVKAVAVECGMPGISFGVAPIELLRTDVQALHPEDINAATSGFNLTVSVLAAPASFTLALTVTLQNGKRVPFGAIRGRRRAIGVQAAPTYTPIMVTCLGRTGTTLLMQMLADHPEIVVERQYPFETRYASYWMHLLGTLANPSQEMKPVEWIPYFGNQTTVRGNPFAFAHYPHADAISHWLGKEYVERLATFCQQSVEAFYAQVARSQHEGDAQYYAEKVYPDRNPDLLWHLNPNAREIFSVRDCRDMLCSILAFLQNPERTLLSYAHVDDIESFVTELADDLSLLLASWRRRSRSAHLVRYEDLVADPVEVVRGVCRYLGIDASPCIVERMARHASVETDAHREHRTSESLAASVGRWQRELSPSVQRLCEEMYADALTEFGYR